MRTQNTLTGAGTEHKTESALPPRSISQYGTTINVVANKTAQKGLGKDNSKEKTERNTESKLGQEKAKENVICSKLI